MFIFLSSGLFGLKYAWLYTFPRVIDNIIEMQKHEMPPNDQY